MRELNTQDVEQVSGGWVPVFYAAAHIGTRLAANPAVRSAAVSGARKVGNWAGGGIVGGSAFEGTRRLINSFTD